MMTLAASPRTGYAPTQDPTGTTARKIRTLVVDDQLIAREVLLRMLKNDNDIEIVGTTVNGREAVETIAQLKPDLVFLDVQMPELDGFGVVSKLEPTGRPAII